MWNFLKWERAQAARRRGSHEGRKSERCNFGSPGRRCGGTAKTLLHLSAGERSTRARGSALPIVPLDMQHFQF